MRREQITQGGNAAVPQLSGRTVLSGSAGITVPGEIAPGVCVGVGGGLSSEAGLHADMAQGDVLLPNTMPHAEYMYGCVATSIGMLLGYYDLYGYRSGNITCSMDDLIPGTISVYSRGSDGGSIYDMKDPSLLATFIASSEYVSRFYGTSSNSELPYTFVNSDPAQGLNVSVWNCLADYLGTGQYWRGNSDLSTMHYYATLNWLNTTEQTYSVGKKIFSKF